MIGLYKKSCDHLEKAGEHYGEHFSFAMNFSLRLIGAGMAVFLHAIIPAVFTSAGSRTVLALNQELQERLKTQNAAPH